MLNLYVGIDLTQWLSLPTPFTDGQPFNFTSGMSDELPGILVGTSPISFDPAVGFTAANPFSGMLHVQETIDGQVVPEPSSAALLVVGLVAMLTLARRSKLRC